MENPTLGKTPPHMLMQWIPKMFALATGALSQGNISGLADLSRRLQLWNRTTQSHFLRRLAEGLEDQAGDGGAHKHTPEKIRETFPRRLQLSTTVADQALTPPRSPCESRLELENQARDAGWFGL